MGAKLIDLGEHGLIDRLARQQAVGPYPFSLAERGSMTIGSLLFLFAILYLGRTRPTVTN